MSNEREQTDLPTEMTVGGRTYVICKILKPGDKYFTGDTIVARAKEMDAHLGKDDREHILAHSNEIPIELQGKVDFVFTDDPHPRIPGFVCFVYWKDDNWVRGGFLLGSKWCGHNWVVLHRKTLGRS